MKKTVFYFGSVESTKRNLEAFTAMYGRDNVEVAKLDNARYAIIVHTESAS